ncbi:cell envelope integrity/translocation protein TolA [Roseobacter cerasinus]|uniref:Cell envelope integrity/translocation protein TolA n=1 Tax=Roseobacter cerasinus TaxID=2602289 RepID=A0A640VVQ6_9RHOB|nr:energy transducer TonB [Roseobacter cerasinus]GFE51490.1 cell envelope integrity/translocation protein TolA [Roseobacter cerasinus]
MHVGHYISGAGHTALIGWLIFGDVFAAEPLPFEATPVSVITGAEYAALVAQGQAPQSATEVAQPSSPEVTPDAPEITVTEDAANDQSVPAPAETPSADDAPDVSQIEPLPQADVSDEAPVLSEPPADVAVLVPEVSDTPVPEAAERVAPEAVAQPDPEALPDPVEQEAVAPDEAGETPQEPAEATAPEAAATKIVTEAERPSAVPDTSIRPPARRPDAPVQTAQPAETEEPEPPAAEELEQEAEPEDPVAAALAEALSGEDTPSSAPSTPQGPPLTAGEKDSLRVAVQACWNVGSLSTDALNTTVVVNVAMTQDGKPVASSIRMASSSGGSEQAARQAFEAARRAIIRCGARGFDLPVDKYSQWQDIEMTFNPERMRIK